MYLSKSLRVQKYNYFYQASDILDTSTCITYVQYLLLLLVGTIHVLMYILSISYLAFIKTTRMHT